MLSAEPRVNSQGLVLYMMFDVPETGLSYSLTFFDQIPDATS